MEKIGLDSLTCESLIKKELIEINGGSEESRKAGYGIGHQLGDALDKCMKVLAPIKWILGI